MTRQYANPDVLVTTDWVDEHRGETDRIRIVESDEDVLLYNTGHIPEAVKIDWFNELQHPVVRDYIDEHKFSELCAEKGISNDTTVVFYGDKNNWWACYAFWVFKLYGHDKCLVMDGGRKKWQDEGREMSRETPHYATAEYGARPEDPTIRAFRDEVFRHIKEDKPLVDVRSHDEFTGKLLHMPDYPQEGALRGGHIPGAANVPWAKAADDDGTFKSREELEQIYQQEEGLDPEDDVVVYCRIGERSSHTWFVLKYLLGFQHVRNYDGSWTEWGNLVGVPIEREEPAPEPV